MHRIEAKTILSSKNGMNLYRGCTHGCIYCDSRSVCYGMEHDFEDVAVKANAPELLEKALRSKRQACMIGNGSMCDPYMPLEDSEKLTLRCTELVYRYGFGFTVITKSDRILRDIELLKSINEKSKCVVQMTMTTYDEALCKIIEPNVCTTRRRYDVLKELQAQGIPTVVWLCPILPFINDTQENLLGILDYCFDAGVKGILCFGMGLTLREGNREYFYQKLDESFPGMKQRYINAFGSSYNCSSPNSAQLMRLFKNKCRFHKVMYDTGEIFTYLSKFESKTEQMSLF